MYSAAESRCSSYRLKWHKSGGAGCYSEYDERLTMVLSQTGFLIASRPLRCSSIGLIIVLFDTLAAISAGSRRIRKDDIEKRCRELNHAALVLASWKAGSI